LLRIAALSSRASPQADSASVPAIAAAISV
jgi:hypothetical protein